MTFEGYNLANANRLEKVYDKQPEELGVNYYTPRTILDMRVWELNVSFNYPLSSRSKQNTSIYQHPR